MTTLFTQEFFLTAGECTPQNKLPLQTLSRNLIEIATLHAHSLGVGYDRLREMGLAWVLSRLAIEIDVWPDVNSTYVIETWVENHNRRFSERDFRIADAKGRTLGYARSIWMAINTSTRAGGDLSQLTALADVMSPRDIPMAQIGRFTPPEGAMPVDRYTFRFTDCDNNRHVNTSRYIELLLNQWSMDFYDRHDIARFEIAFHSECHYGDEVDVLRRDNTASDVDLAIEGVDSRAVSAVRACFIFREI